MNNDGDYIAAYILGVVLTFIGMYVIHLDKQSSSFVIGGLLVIAGVGIIAILFLSLVLEALDDE